MSPDGFMMTVISISIGSAIMQSKEQSESAFKSIHIVQFESIIQTSGSRKVARLEVKHQYSMNGNFHRYFRSLKNH